MDEFCLAKCSAMRGKDIMLLQSWKILGVFDNDFLGAFVLLMVIKSD
jgi:hypothetical protein